MKKKVLSAIALTMAMTLTLGMTVFAANSSSTTNDGNSVVTAPVTANTADPTDAAEKEALKAEADTAKAAIATISADDANASITVNPLQAGEIKNAKEVATQIAIAEVGENMEATVVAGANVDIASMPAGGVTLTITVTGFTADANKNYIVLHLNSATQKWETIDATVSGSTVTAHFDSLSPIVVVEVAEQAGATTTPPASNTTNNSNNSNNSAPSAPAAPAESPKTGAVLPVAGMMTVISLAGAAVSAKKIRNNK